MAPSATRLGHLKLRHFRNLGVQELDFPSEGVAIIGDNAQGKSNLLEAIYYLETFRSFRRARDEHLVAFGEPVFRVVGSFEGAGKPIEIRSGGEEDRGEASLIEDTRATEIAAAYEKQGRRKKVTVDGVEPERLADAIGRAAAVTFSPADVAIVSEGPAERRRFLDIVLSLNRGGYLTALQRFRSILNQRNAALREHAPTAAVQAWDDGLVSAGGAVIRERSRWVETWREAFGRHYAAIAGGRAARMAYAPNVVLGGSDSVEDAYREALAATSERERRLGSTVAGPHRDELLFMVEGDGGEVDVRDFGSGGQRRTAALCLRLVEAATIRASRGREPIVLMDDVFAELDVGRSERVLELIDREEAGQVILTVPKAADIRVRKGALPRWGIRGGMISEFGAGG